MLKRLAPGGAIGMSLLLGASVPSFASDHPPGLQPDLSRSIGVADRLAAIRDAVSELPATRLDRERAEPQLAWGNWRNGGWRNGGWRNGGWANWHNGGWHNGWPNWWHNW
jgi:hypothetical protein